MTDTVKLRSAASDYFLSVTPYIIPSLGTKERILLRSTCREARDIADRAVEALAVPGQSALEAVACFRGVLRRGARPVELFLNPSGDEDDAAHAGEGTSSDRTDHDDDDPCSAAA